MRPLLFLLATVLNLSAAQAQQRWTETDRQALIDNLKRTRDELVRETESLTPEQWAFHEKPGALEHCRNCRTPGHLGSHFRPRNVHRPA